jgi:hypothetical protein
MFGLIEHLLVLTVVCFMADNCAQYIGGLLILAVKPRFKFTNLPPPFTFKIRNYFRLVDFSNGFPRNKKMIITTSHTNGTNRLKTRKLRVENGLDDINVEL